MTPDQIDGLWADFTIVWSDHRSAVRNDARTIAWKSARKVAWNATWDVAWTDAWTDPLNAAWNAFKDAILALLAKDLINSKQFDILYGPWKNVMEES